MAIATGAPARFSLKALRRRYGSLRVNVLACWVLLNGATVLAIGIASLGFAGPRLAALPAGEGGVMARAFAGDLLLLVLLAAAVLATSSFALLYWGLIRPLENFRSNVLNRLEGADEAQGSERMLNGYQLQRSREQLEYALVDNEELRGELVQSRHAQTEVAALLAAVLEKVSDPLLLTDPAGRVLEATAAACDLLGVRRARLVGRGFDELFEPCAALRLAEEGKPSVLAPVLAMRSAIARPQELQLVGDGAARSFEASLACALGGDSAVLGVIAHFGAAARQPAEADPLQLLRLQRDPVSRLPNHELFERRALELIETSRAQMSYHTLMLISIDNLTDVTERHGLKAGEQLRWSVARLVEEHAGPEREVFQTSHDHIVVLSPYRGMGSESDFADRICLAVTSRPYSWRELSFESTVSIGAVEVSPLSEGLSELLEQANQACVIARQAGGSRAHLLKASQALIARRRNDSEWIAWALPRLEQGYAHLISQAVVPLGSEADGSPRKPLFECFVRIEDEDGIWVTPESFMPAMERRQLSHELDLWVIGAVLRELANKPRILEEYECAGVNISAASLRAADFADRVAVLLERSRIDGRRLCFEINESDVAAQTADALAFIERMRPLGIRFALDRYRATGGLHSLRDTPLDFVKIHPSLLSRLHGVVPDPIDLLHVSWINKICQARGIATIATGIEYEDVAQCLREAEVAYGQGVHLNKIGPVLT